MAASVIVVSSQVARGTVGVRAASFALEACGHPVWSVPTVLLPWHPGRNTEAGQGTRIVPDDEAFTNLLEDLARAPWAGEVAAVLTGYFASAAQVRAARRMIDRLRERIPLIHVCDPVMGDLSIGDGGGLYVAEGVAAAIRDELVPQADIATPNRFELRWLSGRDAPFETNDECAKAARALGPRRVLVTSAVPMMRDHTGNLLVDERGALLAEHRAFPEVPNGTGDLTAALFTHNVLSESDARRQLERTTAGCFEVLTRTVRAGGDELAIERNLDALRRPVAPVNVRQLG